MTYDGPRVGIDLGGTTISAVVTGVDAQILGEAHGTTGNHEQVGPVIRRICTLMDSALSKAGVQKSDLRTAGIGLPGEVEPETGIFRSSPIFPSWTEVPVASQLQALSGLCFSIENDANVALLGESVFGAAQDMDPVMLLTLGTGIGGAIRVNTRLTRGLCGSAGEIGHVSVNSTGPPCWCGQRGCLGKLASADALVEHYKAAANGHMPDNVSCGDVAEYFHAGDLSAKQAVDTTASYLAQGIATATCIIAPRCVVLSGGLITLLGKPLIERVQNHLTTRRYPAAVSRVNIVPGALGALSGAVGASILDMIPATASSAPENN